MKGVRAWGIAHWLLNGKIAYLLRSSHMAKVSYMVTIKLEEGIEVWSAHGPGWRRELQILIRTSHILHN